MTVSFTAVALVDQYMEKAQSLIIEKGFSYSHALQSLIEECLTAVHEDEAVCHFFRGEQAFFQHEYKKALAWYSQAKAISHFRFFCHRAIAFLFRELGRYDEGLSAAQKALEVRPDDYLTLMISEDLLNQLHQKNEAQEIHKHMEEIRISEKALYSLQEEVAPSELFQDADEELISLEDLLQRQSSEAEHPSDLNAAKVPTTLEEHLHFDDTDLYTFSLLEEDAEFLNAHNSSQERVEPFFAPLSKELMIAEPPVEMLKDHIFSFQAAQKKLMVNYVERSQQRPHHLADLLHLFSGWAPKQSDQLLSDIDRKPTSGIFVHRKGRGIVVNPGPHFMHYFHQQGYFINDIDEVIVTRAAPQAYANVEAIYDLNYRHNSVSGEGHLIRYFLHQAAYRRLAPLLKPQFKQERNTVHCLARYIDSADVEKLQLAEGISLSYLYPLHDTVGIGEENVAKDSGLGIRLQFERDASDPFDSALPPLSLGYVSGTAWSSDLVRILNGCDIIAAGVEHTSSEDYDKLHYHSEALGYFGAFTLLQETQPRILIIGELSGNEGDIRLELTRKMREEAFSRAPQTTILPADVGLYLDLNTLRLRCTMTGELVDPEAMRIVRPHELFGPLQYLSPRCML